MEIRVSNLPFLLLPLRTKPALQRWERCFPGRLFIQPWLCSISYKFMSLFGWLLILIKTQAWWRAAALPLCICKMRTTFLSIALHTDPQHRSHLQKVPIASGDEVAVSGFHFNCCVLNILKFLFTRTGCLFVFHRESRIYLPFFSPLLFIWN